MKKRQSYIKQLTGLALPYLTGEIPIPDSELYRGNIEQQIGYTQIPTGMVVVKEHWRKEIFMYHSLLPKVHW